MICNTMVGVWGVIEPGVGRTYTDCKVDSECYRAKVCRCERQSLLRYEVPRYTASATRFAIPRHVT